MSTWLVAKTLEVIGEESSRYYSVDFDDGEVGIRAINDSYEVAYSDGWVLSFPASQVIVTYKEVSKEEYLATMKTLYHPRNVDLTF